MKNSRRNPISRDEYICRALGLYTNAKSPQTKIEQRMRERVRAGFDSFYGAEDLYENAKGRGRKKLDKWWKKAKKNIKEAADKVSDAAKDVGKVAAKAGLVVPRQAARGLIEINFRGVASKIANLKPEAYDKLKKRWSDVGGDRGKLESSVEIGKKRKPLACGKKCRAKSKAKAFDGNDFYSFDPATASLIASGLSVLTGVISGILERKNMKDQQAFDQMEKDLGDEERAGDAAPTIPAEEAALDAMQKQLLEQDPRTIIQNNPNLTDDEKLAAIAELNKVLPNPTTGTDMSSTTKTFIYVGIGLLVVGLGFLALRGKK